MDKTTSFTVTFETCDYRSKQPSRAAAVAEALRHQRLNLAHVVKVQNPPPKVTR
jgi:hypothetical protein